MKISLSFFVYLSFFILFLVDFSVHSFPSSPFSLSFLSLIPYPPHPPFFSLSLFIFLCLSLSSTLLHICPHSLPSFLHPTPFLPLITLIPSPPSLLFLSHISSFPVTSECVCAYPSTLKQANLTSYLSEDCVARVCTSHLNILNCNEISQRGKV